MENAKEENKKENGGFVVRNLYDFASVMVSAVIIIAIVFTFFFRFVGVIGPSMMETLHEGDWLAVTAFDRKPQYGQVVIITQPNAYNEPIVKRIIATENQQVNINFNTGDVFVDGQKLDEPYINNPTTNQYDINFPITVPEGCVFVMGDNRQHSSDSRSSAIGCIDTRYILGQVKYKLMEKDSVTDKTSFISPKNWKVR